MKPFITYSLCPGCGRANLDGSSGCPSCGTKLISEDIEGHERYLAHMKKEEFRVLATAVLSSFAFLLCVGFLLAPALGAKIIPGWSFAACTVFSAIAAYRSFARLAFLRRFLRALPR